MNQSSTITILVTKLHKHKVIKILLSVVYVFMPMLLSGFATVPVWFYDHVILASAAVLMLLFGNSLMYGYEHFWWRVKVFSYMFTAHLCFFVSFILENALLELGYYQTPSAVSLLGCGFAVATICTVEGPRPK